MHKLDEKVNITVINFAIAELPSHIGIDSIHEKLSLLLYSIMMSIYLLVNPFHTPQPFLAIISGGFFSSKQIINNQNMAKFDWIPYLEGKYLSYYQWFAVIASTVLIAFAFLSFIMYLVLSKVKYHEQQYQSGTSKKQTLIQKLKTIFFNAGFVFLSIVPLVCAALDVTYMIVGMIGEAGFLCLMVILNNGRQKWDQEVANNKTHYQQAEKAYWQLALKLDPKTKKKLIMMVLISIAANLFMYRTCLCFYNVEIGYYNHALGFGINTYTTRLFQIERSCPPGPPCQIYTTVPEDPEQAFFLNVHTHIDVQKLIVFYRQLDSPHPTEFQNVTAYSFKYDGLEWKTARAVHSALIYGLKPNTKYLTKVFYNNQYWTNGIYKTLPSDPSVPIKMINAGDSGYTEGALNLSKIVATLNPDIFFMGGDIAYDDNMPACSYTWDSFLGMYGKITATLGYMMPILVTVGNHDAGLNELPGVNITVDNRGPGFLIYFPQHYDRNDKFQVIKQVPPVHRRRTVMDFTFSNVHYLLLDSGYMHEFHGWQKQYMINAFERNRDKIKFVNYHVPIYSVCEAFDSNPERFLFALFHWVPNFDKYKVMTAFENHVHSFKRTKPLVGSSPAEKGTVYVGDGAYGALISEMCHPDASLGIFETFSKSNNFWYSEIYSDRVMHIAYDSHGKIIDNFTQLVSDYKISASDNLAGEELEQEEAIEAPKHQYEDL